MSYNSTIKRRECKVTLCKRLVWRDDFCPVHANIFAPKEKKETEKPMHRSIVPTGEMSIAKLTDILDREFSTYIRRRNGDIVRCCTCGATMNWKSAECGHYMKRGNQATRFDERNCHEQCHYCNCNKDGDPIRYREFMIKKYGESETKEIERMATLVKHWTRSELLDLIKFYRTENKKFDQ